MTRIDKREISGASENIDDAPDVLEPRKSNRKRVVKRHWEQAETLKPHKRRLTASNTNLNPDHHTDLSYL